jgi:predicted transcriptional regulator
MGTSARIRARVLDGGDMSKMTEPGTRSARRESRRDMIIKSLQQLPRDASLDQIEDRFWFLMKISRGLEDADAGRTIPQEEVMKYFEENFGFIPTPEELQNGFD